VNAPSLAPFLCRWLPQSLGAVLAWAVVAAAPLPAEASTSTQTIGSIYQQTSFGLGNLSVYPPAPQFTVDPFDASLGELTSTTIRWASGANGSVTVAPGTGGGSWGVDFGGTVKVNDFPYNGYGGGDGYGAGPGETINFLLPNSGRSDTFTAADGSVWGAFTGTTPYSIAYLGSYSGSSPYRISTINISGGQAQVITEAEVMYTYTPNTPTPSVPGPLPLVGAAAAWRWSRRLRGLRADIA
jgi:hypothetical protein